MKSRIEASRVEYRRPGLGRRLAQLAALAVFGSPLMGLLGMVLGAIIDSPHSDRGIALLLYAVLGTAFSLCVLGPLFLLAGLIATYASLPLPDPATLHIDTEGLRIERDRSVRRILRTEFASGLVYPGAIDAGVKRRAFVELYLRNGAVLRAEVPSEAKAHALLEALGIGPAQRRVTVGFGSASGQLAIRLMSLVLLLLFWGAVLNAIYQSSHNDASVAIAAVGLLLSCIWLWKKTELFEVVVGNDGLVVRRANGALSIPYKILEDVDLAEGGTELVLVVKDGHARKRILAARGERDVIAGVSARIREGMAASARHDASAIGDLLGPEGRSLPAWREALRALGKDEGDYRRTAITEEALLGVLADPAAPAPQRIGAALALRGGEHPEARARIRVAADACADDDLRQALEQAAEDELSEEALGRVLRR